MGVILGVFIENTILRLISVLSVTCRDVKQDRETTKVKIHSGTRGPKRSYLQVTGKLITTGMPTFTTTLSQTSQPAPITVTDTKTEDDGPVKGHPISKVESDSY